MAISYKNQYFRYRQYFLNISAIYQKKPEVKMFVEIILTLLTIIIFANFALKPTILTIINLNNEIQTKKDTIAKLDQKSRDLASARTVMNQIASSIPAINQAIPSGPSPEVYIDHIYVLSQDNNLSILGISIGQILIKGEQITRKKIKDLKEFPKGAEEVNITISIKGDYLSIMNFVIALEDTRRPIKIDTISIGSTNADNQKIIVGTISGRLPYIKNEK